MAISSKNLASTSCDEQVPDIFRALIEIIKIKMLCYVPIICVSANR